MRRVSTPVSSSRSAMTAPRVWPSYGLPCGALAWRTNWPPLDAQRDAAVATTTEPDSREPQGDDRIRHLVQLRGIGPQVATVLDREVFYRRFKNRRALGSYLGLTPSPFQSGSMDRG